jgi:hypothetical protein
MGEAMTNERLMRSKKSRVSSDAIFATVSSPVKLALAVRAKSRGALASLMVFPSCVTTSTVR